MFLEPISPPLLWLRNLYRTKHLTSELTHFVNPCNIGRSGEAVLL